MAVGDVTLHLNFTPGGGNTEIQTLTRCKLIAGYAGGAAYSKLHISTDGITYYPIGSVSRLSLGTGTTSENSYLLLPPKTFVRITNTGSLPTGTIIICVEY